LAGFLPTQQQYKFVLCFILTIAVFEMLTVGYQEIIQHFNNFPY